MSEKTSSSCWVQSLYQAKAAEVLLYGRALGLSQVEAEDVLQETFLGLLKLSAPPLQPAGFVIRCFRNRALNHRRSLWRRIAREFEAHRWFESSGEPLKKEEQAMACLAQLPQDQREIIVLKIWHQETFESIGRLLDLSPNTAAGRYRYGLQKLRELLKGCNDDARTGFGRNDAPMVASKTICPGLREAF